MYVPEASAGRRDKSEQPADRANDSPSMKLCGWRWRGGPRWACNGMRLLALGVLPSVLYACAADPTPAVIDAAATDSPGDPAPPDQSFFEMDASDTCLTTVPRTTPLPSDAGESTCLFQISPPIPTVGRGYEVVADGVVLPSTEYVLYGGRDRLELTGQTCVDYRAGTIKDVSVFVHCGVG